MNSISISDLHDASQKLGPKDLVLDVRTPEEFAEGHVPGALNIPYDELEGRGQEVSGRDQIYIYCRAGRRASVAASVLQHLGLDSLQIKKLLVVTEGGFPEWEDERYPVEK